MYRIPYLVEIGVQKDTVHGYCHSTPMLIIQPLPRVSKMHCNHLLLAIGTAYHAERITVGNI